VNALNSMCKAWPMCSIDKEWIGAMRKQSAACSLKAHSASGGFVPSKPFLRGRAGSGHHRRRKFMLRFSKNWVVRISDLDC
jgi:hypothetical protein